MTENENNIFEEKLNGGNIRIADEVVATIASMAASGIAGVSGMRGGVVGDIAEKLTKKQSTKGIKVEINDNIAVIDVFFVVEYGYLIHEVCKNIQEAVKATVETMTGLEVTAVNVSAQGVSFPAPEKNEGLQEEVEDKE